MSDYKEQVIKKTALETKCSIRCKMPSELKGLGSSYVSSDQEFKLFLNAGSECFKPYCIRIERHVSSLLKPRPTALIH